MSDARRLLLARLVKTCAIVVAAGLIAVLLGSIWPTVTSQRVSIYVDASKLQPGEFISTSIGNLPVLVVRRGEMQLASLDDSLVNDPNSWQSNEPDGVDTTHRGLDARFLVVEALGTALQCELTVLAPSSEPFQGRPWFGGLADKCQGQRYDWAGRAYLGQTAQRNVRVLPHAISAEDALTISLP